MQKKRRLVVIISIALAVVLLHLLFPSYRQRERKYYAEQENYISVTAVVSEVAYFGNDQIVVYVRDKSVDFTDTGFILNGDNAQIARKNGIEDKIYPGAVITFTCAPRYFGDGYNIPMVALCIDGDSILDFETGFRNLNRQYTWRYTNEPNENG